MDVNREPCDVLALWRESGEWWSFEPYREYCRFIDRDGIRRESSTELSPFALPGGPASPYVENNREDLDLGEREQHGECCSRLWDPRACYEL